jgi:hypothetical protein
VKLIQHEQHPRTLLQVLSIRVKTSIRVLPRQILSDRDNFYLFEIGRLNCRTFVFCWFVSKTSISVNVDPCQNVDPCFAASNFVQLGQFLPFWNWQTKLQNFCFLSIRVKNVDLCLTSIHVKTSIRVLPRQILSNWDNFYLFEIGRLNCRTFVFCQFVSKTLIRVKNVDSCLPVFVDSCQKTSIRVYRFKFWRFVSKTSIRVCRVKFCPIGTIFTFLKLAD